MKKIVLFACAAIAFASCGNKTAQNEAGQDTAAVDTAAVATATAVADSITNVLAEEVKTAQQDPSKLQATLAQAQTIYAQMVKDGKLEDAKKYASAVQEFINNNAESIKTAANNATVVSLIDGIKNLPTSADATADAALKAVSADAQTIANGAKDAAVNAANQTVENAKSTAKAAVDSKVNEGKAAVNAAKTAATNKVNEAQTKAANKVNEATNKANAAANNAINSAASKLLGK